MASLWGVRLADISEGRSFGGRSVVAEAAKAFRRSVKSMITAARFDTSPGSWNSPVNLSIASLIASLPSFADGPRISSYHQPPTERANVNVQGTSTSVHKTLIPAFACAFSGSPMEPRESVQIVRTTMSTVSSVPLGGLDRRTQTKARRVSKAISSVKESVGWKISEHCRLMHCATTEYIPRVSMHSKLSAQTPSLCQSHKQENKRPSSVKRPATYDATMLLGDHHCRKRKPWLMMTQWQAFQGTE